MQPSPAQYRTSGNPHFSIDREGSSSELVMMKIARMFTLYLAFIILLRLISPLSDKSIEYYCFGVEWPMRKSSFDKVLLAKVS